MVPRLFKRFTLPRRALLHSLAVFPLPVLTPGPLNFADFHTRGAAGLYAPISSIYAPAPGAPLYLCCRIAVSISVIIVAAHIVVVR